MYTSLKEVKNNSPCCSRNYKFINIYSILYIVSILLFFIIGILYETSIIKKKKHFKNCNWYNGLILLLCIPILAIIANRIQTYLQIHSIYFWNMTHVIAYMGLTLLAPEQWPFWLSIGILWEYLECYFYCWDPKLLVCNGYNDIIANIAGISIGMWIRYAMEDDDSP
jgi:hypothetical protein